jgi:hypothetical protein
MDAARTGLKAGLIAAGALAAGLAAGAALWAGNDGGDGEPMAAAAAGGDLYVVDGRLASARTTGPGTFQVDLEGATVLWFSDRPARLHGNRPIGRFVAQWPSTFGADQPNAAVLALSDDGSHRPVVVELQPPTFDRSAGVVSFVLRPERGSEALDPRRFLTALDRVRSQRGRFVLFVDSGAPLPPASLPAAPTAAVLAAAFADGQQAIDVLQSVAAASEGALNAQAEADLEALSQQAGAGR